MWPELSAEAIGVHALQYSGDAALVSAHELSDFVDGRGLQRDGGIAFVTAANRERWVGTIRGAIPRMDVV
jgi:hypothetical protein